MNKLKWIMAGILAISLTGAPAGMAKEAKRIDPAREKDLKSPEDGNPVTLTIRNQRKTTISTWWIDYDGERVEYEEVEAGKEDEQVTFPGHYWVILDSKGKALGIYETPKEDATITVGAAENLLPRLDPDKEEGLKSPEDGEEVVLTIRNTRKTEVSTWWIDYDGERVQYQDVAAGEEAEQITYPGHYWVMADSKGKALGIYKTPNENGVILVK